MKRLVTWIVLAVFGMVAVGCTMEQPRPTAQAYPQYRQTADTQAEDSADCSAWASDQTGYRPSSTAQGAGIGAAVGALGGAAAGAAIGAATGGGSGAAKGAAIGAAAGGVGGAVTGGAMKYSRDRRGYNQAYASCMQARGYNVR
jgi:outer membrane lipoprotein SlyB